MAVKLPVAMFPVSERAMKPVAFVIGVLVLMAVLAKKNKPAQSQPQPN